MTPQCVSSKKETQYWMGLKKFPQCLAAGMAVIGIWHAGRAAAAEGIETIKSTLAKLWEYQAENGKERGWKLSFGFPEMAVNEYIKYLIATNARPGVKEAQVHFAGNNVVDLTCVIDLDQVRSWDPQAIPQDSPLRARGTLKVNAKIDVKVNDSLATFSVESAKDMEGDTPMPVIATLFRVVASHQAEHFDIDKPIRLPFPIKQVKIGGGSVSAETP